MRAFERINIPYIYYTTFDVIVICFLIDFVVPFMLHCSMVIINREHKRRSGQHSFVFICLATTSPISLTAHKQTAHSGLIAKLS